MESKLSVNEQHLDWAIVEPDKIESVAFRDLVSRIQQANRDLKGQVTNSNTWSNWRDSHWKQRR